MKQNRVAIFLGLYEFCSQFTVFGMSISESFNNHYEVRMVAILLLVVSQEKDFSGMCT